nr:hypothetical protein [Fodinicola feengrottensis]
MYPTQPANGMLACSEPIATRLAPAVSRSFTSNSRKVSRAATGPTARLRSMLSRVIVSAGLCSSYAMACTTDRTFSTAAVTEPANPISVASATTTFARPGIARAMAFARSWFRSTQTTMSCDSANSRAQAPPMSPPAPTTTAVRSSPIRLSCRENDVDPIVGVSE